MSIKGYKGFQKGLICRDKQYQIGKEYKHKGELKLCESGFHFCENPLDVLEYYDLVGSEFAKVEATGKVEKDEEKSVTDKIKIKTKLDLGMFIKASVDFLFEKCKVEETGGEKIQANKEDSAKLASSGYYAQLASSGDYAQLASSGYSAQLASSGYSAQLASSGGSARLASSGDSAKLELNGQDSVGAAIGIGSRIKGKKGDWITLAEWKYDNGKSRYVPVCVKSAQIDGKELKEDTWYQLVGEKFKQII
jgi:hypothetical protein